MSSTKNGSGLMVETHPESGWGGPEVGTPRRLPPQRAGELAENIFPEEWMEPLFEAVNAEFDAMMAGQNPKGVWSGQLRQVLRQALAQEAHNLRVAEDKLRAVLPKLARAAAESSFKNMLEEQRDFAWVRSQRLEAAEKLLGAALADQECAAMEGFLTGITEIIEENPRGAERDFSLISAVRKVQEYKIACYGCARTFAQILGVEEVTGLLEANALDEAQTHAKLVYLAEFVRPL